MDGQPWGIFYIEFETKRLPISVMRRILNRLVTKQRSRKADQATWNLDDLLFISAVGSEQSTQREMTFAHFHQESGDLPTLRVLGWDGGDTALKIEYVAQMLKEKLRWPADPMNAAAWRELWAAAFRHKPGHVIRTAEALAGRLAELARAIRDAAQALMAHETEQGHLRRLHKAFQTALIHDLSEADFADTYAQTITYGLLTAAISRTEMSGGQYGTALVAENVTDMVPVTNPFLREMLETFLHAGGRQGGIDFDELGIQDVVELLRGEETDLPAILRDFGNRTQGEDPVIHFYEHFLTAYNKKLKVQRGVFYTPRPVVSYIVRSVHELLQTEFGLADGLADSATWGEMEARLPGLTRPAAAAPDDPFVTILDPATGTATFLVEVIDVIYKTMKAKWKKAGLTEAEQRAAWNEYVPRHLLPRLYGYELMMAPYAIAHMKIGLKLYETGYRFQSEERVRVYLTNALEEPSPLAEQSAANLFEALGHEAQSVNEVKRRIQFTVVIGNPPYSAISSNLAPEFRRIVDPYRYVNGIRIRERSMLQFEKNIQDDYVKFWAFSQAKIKGTNAGIVALITNHSYLDGPTLRGLRWNLLTKFDKLWFLDLHGNANKGEEPPNNQSNDNVFDIKQGVGIAFCIKLPHCEPRSKIRVAELWGDRAEKYERLSTDTVYKTPFTAIQVTEPYFYFVITCDTPEMAEWESWIPLVEIFTKRSTGTETGFDDLLVGFSKAEVESKLAFFSDKQKSKEEISEKFNVSEGHASELYLRRLELSNVKDTEIRLFQLRAYDYRYAFLRKNLLKTNSFNVMLELDNRSPGLIITRQTKERFTAFSINSFCGHKITSSYDRSYVFPLFTKDDTGLFPIKSSCISRKVLMHFRSLLNKNIDDLDLALKIFCYSLAILNSPTYNALFSSQLKRDWPRLPITNNINLFINVSHIGKSLMGLHLLESPVLETAGATVPYQGGMPSARLVAGYPKFANGAVQVNAAERFEGVTEQVWNFHIGGYQVCHKWLKDRRGRSLSAEEIAHYQKVVVALGETIRLMGEVDEVIEAHGGWPVR
ncbi:MAG TPA: hypothetical protein PKM21_17440 [Anaerolineales bacterium]|nr:hypothetical protein [Anaerolineales bacterium]